MKMPAGKICGRQSILNSFSLLKFFLLFQTCNQIFKNLFPEGILCRTNIRKTDIIERTIEQCGNKKMKKQMTIGDIPHTQLINFLRLLNLGKI